MKPSRRRQTKAQRQAQEQRPAVSKYRRKFTEQRADESPLATALVAAGIQTNKR